MYPSCCLGARFAPQASVDEDRGHHPLPTVSGIDQAKAWVVITHIESRWVGTVVQIEIDFAEQNQCFVVKGASGIGVGLCGDAGAHDQGSIETHCHLMLGIAQEPSFV